jgi:imidazolonepropionase-like amidohydrolase
VTGSALSKTFFLVLLTFALASPGALSQRRFVLQGATLINGIFGRPLTDHVVVVEGGRITGVGKKNRVIIPQGAEVIDVSGKFIVPGLIDANVHEESIADWRRYLAWGVTSVNCLYENSDTALEREAWSRSDTLAAPAIYATAPVFTVKGGWWEGEGFPIDPGVNRFPETPAEAREAVRALHAKGITRIRLMVDDMGWCRDPLPRLKKMDPGVMNALLDEARKLRIVSEVHAPEFSDASAAVAGGASALVHGVIDQRVDAPFIESILSGDIFYVPTFSLYHFLASPDSFIAHALEDSAFRTSLPPETIAALTSPEYAEHYRQLYPNQAYVASMLGILNENTTSIAHNYAQLAMGTDLWDLPGIGAHLELASMVDAGLTPMQAVTAATFLSAKFLGILPRTGTIEPGKDADLLVLDADPLADIRNTRKIDMVVKKGIIFRPGDLAGTGGR